jgi:hypothetical protein
MDDKNEAAGKSGGEKESPELLTKEEFIKRFGLYAAAIPVAIITLMAPGVSRAVGSDGGPP